MGDQFAGAAVVGIGRTAYTRKSGRTTLAMTVEAVRNAVADAGLKLSDVDGIINFNTGDSASSMRVAHAIGNDDCGWTVDIMGGGNVVCGVVATAAAAIITGQCDVAVVFRTLGSGTRYGKINGTIEVPGDLQFAAPHGHLVPPQWFAMGARRHQHIYGSKAEDLGAIAVQQRAHALNNPHAVAKSAMSIDDYMESRMVFDPFRVPDCCYEVDGSVALVLTSAKRAKDLPHKPVTIVGQGDSFGFGGNVDEFDDLTCMYSRDAAKRLWKNTGLKAQDMDVALMYDCFTYTVMATFEDFGFCGKGEVGDFFRAGKATYGGDVVVNPHGGLLSEGYIHGLNHHYEAVLQLRGEAGNRQVENAELALVTAGAGPFGTSLVYSGASA
ncbi:MAG: nonspecific lipid-transfer protein [Acidimicrobiia bacterium]